MRKFKLPKGEAKGAIWSRRGFYISARHWCDAASQISVLFGPPEDGFDWQPSGFQVADARHNPTRAAKLIANRFR